MACWNADNCTMNANVAENNGRSDGGPDVNGSLSGFYSHQARYVIYSNNQSRAHTNGYGYWCSGCTDSVMTGNVAEGNSHGGFRVNDAMFVSVVGNISKENTGSGQGSEFLVSGSSYVTLGGNISNSDESYAFVVTAGSRNPSTVTVSGNVAKGPGTDCFYGGPSGATFLIFANNTCEGPLRHGVNLAGASLSKVLGNTINNSAGQNCGRFSAIRVDGDYNTVQANTYTDDVGGCRKYGVELTAEAGDNMVKDNIIKEYNASGQAVLDSGLGNAVEDNWSK